MSEYLTLDHELINNLRSLIEDNNDFNFVEAGLSFVDSIFTESTNQSTVDHNFFLESYIKLISNGSLKITAENAKLIYLDIASWLNEEIGTGIFSDNPFLVYVNFTESQKVKLFENSGESVLRIFMNQGHIWRIKDASSNQKEVYPEKLIFKEQSPSFIEPFVDFVAKMIEEGTLDLFSSKIISEITEENYGFNRFQIDIAKVINDFIVLSADESTYQPLKLRFTEKYSNYYLKLSLDNDGFYSLPQSIYKQAPTKVPKNALSLAEKVNFTNPNFLQYPTTILQDENGNVIEEIKNDLMNFKDLEGTSIIDYNFVFQQDPWLISGVFVDDLTNTVNTPFIKKWISRNIYKRTTTNKHIENLITGAYIDFLVDISKDYEDGSLSRTIGNHYKKSLNSESTLLVLEYVFFEKIISAKKKFFDLIAAAVDPESPGGVDVTAEEREKAYKESAEAFKTGQGKDIPDPPSEEDIANRQKFFKQCALMLNMPELRDVYQQELNSKYDGKLPFDGRFTTLGCKDEEQELMLTRLVSSKKEQLLFELETHKVSRLVPKVRLFKVFHDPTDGEKEVEFIFNRTSKQRDSFLSADFDKGNGVGLKNFSFEFNGTSPATARNDITASLTLFFQSFEDFTRSRKASNEDDYRYVDLIIQPTPDKKGEVGGVEIQAGRQYEPQFYRIRADVGYVLPTEADGFTPDEIEALRVSNKSFFLNMVDHDISFGKDGTVEIKISYRAYLESLLKHPRLDALASPELISRRIANAREFAKQVQNKECSVEQLKELQISLAAQETVLVKQSLSSIITRLTKRGAIYTALIKKEDKEFFLNKGFFKTCTLEKGSIADGSNGVDVKLVLNSDLPESSDDFDFIDSADRSVQFFYFGDLLYTVLDCVYDEGNKIRKGTGFNRNSIILGSFEFEPFQQNQKTGNVYNIADIPVSVDFFSRWFVDNVVNQKSTRKTFPLMNFVRSFSNNLIKPALIENCVNRKLETRLRFQTSQITAFEPKGKNPLSKHYKLTSERDFVALDVETLRSGKDPTLPLKGGPSNDANSSFKDFHTFIVLSALGSTLSFAGNGKYGEDIKQGRFHLHIGQNAGLVKTLSLSKSDQQYIREARFFQNGIDGLLQLSAVYVANIEMFGNTLFYPGMEFFFNPYGIGGPDFDPRLQASDANKLGIGGYHTITSVKSSISPGKFTTSIAGQQYYSGDGSGNPNTVKMKNADQGPGKIEEYKPTDETENNDGFAKCNQVILNAQNYSFEESTTAGTSADVTGGSSSPPIETADDSEPQESDGSTTAASNEELGESDASVVDPRITPAATQTGGSNPEPSTEESEPEPEVVVITEESQSAKPVVEKTYSGYLRTELEETVRVSSTTYSVQSKIKQVGGRVTEMSDGTVYFETMTTAGFGSKVVIDDHSRISKNRGGG